MTFRKKPLGAPATARRPHVVSVRLSPEEHEGVERAAARDGRSIGEWLREAIRKMVRFEDARAGRPL